ncbi:MAG TPA: rRNA maturation RNase YbeY [Caulobacteraceae bacterium]|nr:rRNA maturation RNase YbeY [Caulobacteraceae bacterium]
MSPRRRDEIELEIALLNPNRYSEASARRLRPWLGRVLRELLGERPPGAGEVTSLGVRLAGDRFMRRANREFRGKDQTTDVLSFPGDGTHLGDILVSVPQARRQAAAAGRDPAREIRVLLLHGVLHCLGHDHEVDGGEMERLERRLRRRWIGAPASRPRLRPATGVAIGDNRSRDRPSPVAALVAGRRTVRRAR